MIHKTTYLLYSFMLITNFSMCQQLKRNNYRYQTKLISIDSRSEKSLISTSNFVSYKQYLFEFIDKIVIDDTINFISNNSRRVTTTNIEGVFVIPFNTNTYYEFNNFSKEAILKKEGNLFDKKVGKIFKDRNLKEDSILNKYIKEIKPTDTLINNIKCSYIDFSTISNDNYKKVILLVKDRYLNSVYKLQGDRIPDKNYTIIGYYYYSLQRKEGVVEEISEKKPITQNELEVCESIIAKIKKK